MIDKTIIDSLRECALAIRDERRLSANTAMRVGTMFVDIIDALGIVEGGSRGLDDMFTKTPGRTHVDENGDTVVDTWLIRANYGLYSVGDVVAFGRDGGDAEPVPAGKAYFGELLDVIGAGAPNSATPYWGWNGKTFGWIGGDGSGVGSVSWNDVNGKPSTLAGYGITEEDALISSVKTFATTQAMAAQSLAQQWVESQGYLSSGADFVHIAGKETIGGVKTFTDDLHANDNLYVAKETILSGTLRGVNAEFGEKVKSNTLDVTGLATFGSINTDGEIKAGTLYASGDVNVNAANIRGEMKVLSKAVFSSSVFAETSFTAADITVNGTSRLYGNVITYGVKPETDNKHSIGTSSSRYQQIYVNKVKIGDAVLQWNANKGTLELKNTISGNIAHFSASGDITALGTDPSDEGGGTGKAYFSELLDVIDAGSPNSATPYWGWNGKTFGWIGGDRVTSAAIISALGYSPYDASNPAGYITASALAGYATETFVTSKGYATEGWVTQQGYLTPTSLYSDKKVMRYVGSNVIASPDNDTVESWRQIGMSLSFNADTENKIFLKDQPSRYGLILNLCAPSQNVNQLWFNQPGGNIYHRGGNGNGWEGKASNEGKWVAIVDEANIKNYAAGSLDTTHTIWGQNFNGTQDVAGTLSGVEGIKFKPNTESDKGDRYITMHGKYTDGACLQFKNDAIFIYDYHTRDTGGFYGEILGYHEDTHVLNVGTGGINTNIRGTITISGAATTTSSVTVGGLLEANSNVNVNGQLNVNAMLNFTNSQSHAITSGTYLRFAVGGKSASTIADCAMVVGYKDTTNNRALGVGIGGTLPQTGYSLSVKGNTHFDGNAYVKDGFIRIGNIVLRNDGDKLLLSHATTGQMAHLCASGDVVAFGADTSEGGGGAGKAYLHELLDVDIDNSTLVNNDILIYHGDKWVKHNLHTTLNGYVTQSQISGYATIVSLSDYAKTSDLSKYMLADNVRLGIYEEGENNTILAELHVGNTSAYLLGWGYAQLLTEEFENLETSIANTYLTKSEVSLTLNSHKDDNGQTIIDSAALGIKGTSIDLVTDVDRERWDDKWDYNENTIKNVVVNKASALVTTEDAKYVHIAGAETIQGTKTFTNGVKTNNLGFYSNDKVYFDTNGNLGITGGNWYIRGNSVFGNPYGITLATQPSKLIYAGIHTATPQYPLDINGSARIGGDVLVGTAGAKIWFDPAIGAIRTNCHIVADGDVVAMGGIGTDNPAVLDTLNVASEVNIGSTTIFNGDGKTYMVSESEIYFMPQGVTGLEIEPWGIRTPGLAFGDNTANLITSVVANKQSSYIDVVIDGQKYRISAQKIS